MPPINIDGTGVSGITIDGTDVSEVTMDGDVVWSAIPDSVVIQYYANTWSSSDATWNDDATSDGSQDMSLSGGLSDATLSDGSEAISGDGTDDHGLTTLPSELEGSSLTSFSCEFAVQWTTTTTGYLAAIQNSGDNQGIEVRINQNEQFNRDSGNIFFILEAPNNDRLDVSLSTNPNLDDGNRHDVSIIVNDSTANDVDIIIDGTQVSTSTKLTDSPGSFTTWDTDMAFLAKNVGGSLIEYTPTTVGAWRWHDSAISSQTISDYP